jgi:hypothetical protein
MIVRSLRYYWRTNAALALGFAAVVATLAGALLVGDSVRGSLRQLIGQRLGSTNYVVSSPIFFREELATEVGGTPAIVIPGKTEIYGLPSQRDIAVTPALARKSGDTLLVRIERPSPIPKESVHGRKDEIARTLRLPTAHVQEGLSLKQQQGPVYAVYMPLARLQRELRTPGQINTILSTSKPSLDRATLADLGLRLRPVANAISVESTSTMLPDAVLQAAGPGQPIFAYLANRIAAREHATPYSLVVAADFMPIQPDGIVLNDWTARDLNARPGDSVTLEYYVWEQSGNLATRSAQFHVQAIVPIQGFAADRDLAPEYPGITKARSLHDWDPPFPMNLGLIRPKDEDYWNRYRTTPKAFIAYSTGRRLWGTRFGNATSIRVPPRPGFAEDLRRRLDPRQLGMTVADARQSGRAASQGSTDFGEYFAYFSFFVLASALILAGLLFRLSIEQRMREIGMLRALGWPPRRLAGLFLGEGALVALAGSLLGAVAALAYCALVLWGLRTWWQDAAGTTELHLFAGPLSLIEGALGGFVMALGAMWWSLRGVGRLSPRALLAGTVRAESSGVRIRSGPPQAEGLPHFGLAAPPRFSTVPHNTWAVILLAIALLLLAAGAMRRIDPAAAFFGGAALLLIAALVWTAALIGRPPAAMACTSLWRLGARSTAFRPGRSIAGIALIASATFLIAGLDAFRQHVLPSTDPHSGTGGFALVGESELPIVYDPNTLVPGARFYSFRLHPGDDASCLNLYQPRNPRVLGAPESFLRLNRFQFSEPRDNPWLSLDTDPGDGTIPAIADANSITYILHRKVGDEFILNPDSDRPVRLKLVAALEGSMLQSELIVSESNFLKAFPQEQGYRFFLIDTAQSPASLQDALSDYVFDATRSAGRLAAYRQVENTYLSTFQALGAVGLLLGTAGLATVLLRNVLERRREFALLRALGYERSDIQWIVIAENLFIALTGLTIGTVCALIAVLPTVLERGGHAPVAAVVALLIAVPATALLSSLLAVRAVAQAPLLAALRAE